jgi:Gamma-glutamyltranspeptidase
VFTTRPELVGTYGMVASTHWLASSAGMAVLESGGNAFDAAVAAGLTLLVVEPHLNGPGGEAPILLHSPGRARTLVIGGQGPAPAAASIAHFERLDLDLVLAPRPLAAAARRAEETPGRAFVYGLVSLPVFFVLCVVLAMSIIRIPLLLLLAPAYLSLLFFGALVAAFFLGTRVLMFTGRYRVGNAMAAVVGAMILAATTFIPVLGDLILYALCLLGAGAAILALFSRRSPRAAHSSYEAYVRDRAGG